MAGAGGLPPYKIALKSTTKISLNDRFSTLRKQGDPASTLTTIRQRMQQVRQASARNRRLAQQMENRPSVIAALKIKKKSLKQRLGVGVKARLSLGGQGMVQFRGNRGIGRGRVQIGRGSPRGGFRRAGGARVYTNTRGRGISPLIRTRLGNQTGFANRRGNRGKLSPGRSRRGRGFVQRGGTQFGTRGGSPGGSGWRPRGQFSRGNQQGSNFRGRSGSGNFRGGRRRQQQRGGGRGGGRGRGAGGGMRGRNQQNKNVTPATKQELDQQLEDYMSKTKSHLDAELDAYMAEAATE